MSTWDDVRRLAAGLPESNERDECSWRARDKLFAWRRPLRRKDIDELGEQVPTGEVLAVRVPDEAWARRAPKRVLRAWQVEAGTGS